MTSETQKALLVASTPALAMISMSQINEFLGMVGSILGIAFLLWRWRREAKSKP